jgi:hypothetical protein
VKPLCDGINEPGGDLEAVAFVGIDTGCLFSMKIFFGEM